MVGGGRAGRGQARGSVVLTQGTGGVSLFAPAIREEARRAGRGDDVERGQVREAHRKSTVPTRSSTIAAKAELDEARARTWRAARSTSSSRSAARPDAGRLAASRPPRAERSPLIGVPLRCQSLDHVAACSRGNAAKVRLPGRVTCGPREEPRCDDPRHRGERPRSVHLRPLCLRRRACWCAPAHDRKRACGQDRDTDGGVGRIQPSPKQPFSETPQASPSEGNT